MKAKVCQIGLTAACQIKFTAVLIACLSISACSGGGSAILRQEAATGLRGGLPDAARGVLRIERGAQVSRMGCILRYTAYVPPRARAGDVAVIGHGFMRSQARMADLARALAGAGVTAMTLDFCDSRPWSGHAISNGLDMIGIANARHARRVVYVGFSAGALAALIAGRNDPRALGVVALDLVDAGGLGRRLAVGLERPLIGLAGAPSACNAYNNGLAVYAASPDSALESFPEAGHCDFEGPTDWLCRLACEAGPEDRIGDREVRWAIIRSSVAAVTGLFARHLRP